jgi:hypothetical protein
VDALEQLIALVPPPARPRLGPAGWAEVTGRLGTALPPDYVALAERYAGAELRDWLYLYQPLDLTAPGGLVRNAYGAGEAYRTLRRDFPDDFPRAAFPEPGGFLAAAVSLDGDWVGWLTEGPPERWPTMVWPRHARGDTVLPRTLTEVLLDWATGALAVPGLPVLDDDED